MSRGQIELNAAPPSVRKAFSSHSMGGELGDQVRHVSIDGQDVYVAKVDPSEAQDVQLYVTADGEILKTQQEVELDKAPQEIRSAIEKLSEQDGNNFSKLFREMREGKLSYIAEIKRSNQPSLNLQIDESGNVVKQWEAPEAGGRDQE